jgi:hypothetical protein
MTIQQQALRFGQRRVTGRIVRALPWVGAVVALATLGSTIRRKGLVRGSVDSALNAIPYVGGAKGVAEMMRGRDFLADKPDGTSLPSRR